MRITWRLLRLGRSHAGWLAAGIALNVAVTLANAGLLALSGWFITAMTLSGLGGTPIEYFAPAAAIRGLAVLRTAGRYGERLVTHEATFRLLAELRTWFYASLEPLAPAGLQRHRGGDLLSRIRADIDSLDNLYLRVLTPTVGALLSTLLMIGFLALFSGAAALLLAAGLAAAGAALPFAAQRLGNAPGQRAVRFRAELTGAVTDATAGLGELLVDDALAGRRAVIEALGRSVIAARRRQAHLGIVGSALAGLVAAGTLWAALVIGIPSVHTGSLSGPELAMIAFLVLASFEAVSPLPGAFQAWGETREAARRIFELVDAEPAVVEPASPAPVPGRFDIRVRGLRLRYAAEVAPALDGVDFDLPQGERLGVIGASGSGKTSLLNVLLRFWDRQTGEVTIGGTPIEALAGDTVRGLYSVVAQRTHLFNATIRENLLLARPGASDAELHRALDQAAFADEVAALPDGLGTVVGENGARFSGGQARRLSLARAFLKDAPILLLDEPTAGLDPVTEQMVLDGLQTLMHSRTTLLITHHPQALRDVDRVIMLERGRVIPQESSQADSSAMMQLD